jgi:hypothetical protein
MRTANSRRSAGPYPPCPDCKSTRNRCIRPSGHEADAWHLAREDALAKLCRCLGVCDPWLARRAASAARKNATKEGRR